MDLKGQSPLRKEYPGDILTSARQLHLLINEVLERARQHARSVDDRASPFRSAGWPFGPWTTPRDSSGKKTILVVEDNPITRKVARVALAAEGFSAWFKVR